MKAMNTTTKDVSLEELRELLDELPDGTVISIEIKVVLEDG